MGVIRGYVRIRADHRLTGKGVKRVGMGQLPDGIIIHAGLVQFGEEDLVKVGVGFGFAAARLGRIVPAPVMAEHQVIAEADIQHHLDALNVIRVAHLPADAVVFDPRAVPGDFGVQIEVCFILRVNPDVALQRISGLFDDTELIFHHPAPDRVAADDGVDCLCCPCCRPQHLRF